MRFFCVYLKVTSFESSKRSSMWLIRIKSQNSCSSKIRKLRFWKKRDFKMKCCIINIGIMIFILLILIISVIGREDSMILNFQVRQRVEIIWFLEKNIKTSENWEVFGRRKYTDFGNSNYWSNFAMKGLPLFYIFFWILLDYK